MEHGAPGLLARKTWRTLEPLHAMIYFVPEATEEYARLGLAGRSGYFASRAAPMGAVGAEVVASTFFNFNPALVRRSIPRAWERTTPEEVLSARLRAVDRALRRLLGPETLASPAMRRAAELARALATPVADAAEGRPLCAAHARLPWPEVPHLALWHAQSVLREYRGDGHVALLVTLGLSGVDALVTHAASGDVAPGLLQATRGWSDQQWHAAITDLRARGWLEHAATLALSGEGAARRAEVEDRTDALAASPYAQLGEEGCAELRALVRPWSVLAATELVLTR